MYNADRTLSGKTMVRGADFDGDSYHLVVHACVFNSENKMLIQKRQPFKEGWPGMWDITVGGSAVAGETSQSAIERELFEEIGLKLDFQNTRPHLSVNYDVGFDDIYLIEKDVDIGSLALQFEEVEQVKWASIEEIYHKLDVGEFIPYHKSLIALFFDMRRHYGSHRI